MREESDDGEEEEDDDESPSFSHRVRDYFHERLLALGWLVPLWIAIQQFPTTVWLIELSRHFTIYWLVLAVVLTGFMIWWRRRVRAVLCALTAAALLPPVLPHFREPPPPLPLAAAHAAESPSFTVLTCNLLLIPRDPEATIKALTEADPDVLLLLELTPEWKRLLSAVLARYPVVKTSAQDDSFGIGFATRLPVSDAQISEPVGRGFPIVSCILTVGARRVEFLGVHPMNPMLPAGAEIWREQFAAYPGILEEWKADAAIVAGDLNCTPYARTFSTFLATTGLRDSAAGRGLANTWSGVGLITLGLPLDHILHSPALEVQQREVGPATGSDHRWIFARMAFAK